MSEISELLERFRRGPELLAAALTGVAGSEQDFVPEPGKWSIRQIAAHVADSELEGAVRFRRILAEDNPILQAYNQDLWAVKLDYSKRKPSHALETFRRIRTENYELFKDIPEAAFQRTGNHTERGTVTLLDLLKIYATHAEKHSHQIRLVRDQFRQAKTAAKV